MVMDLTVGFVLWLRSPDLHSWLFLSNGRCSAGLHTVLLVPRYWFLLLPLLVLSGSCFC